MSPIEWTLLDEPCGQGGADNMAADSALLAAAHGGAAFLRLYRWTPPCLSFGRNESACSRYDREAIARLELATVRRPTGGRAVWHEAELTYAVAGPVALFGSLTQTYFAIHRLIATALRQLGVDAQLAAPGARSPGTSAGACFASPVGGELIVEGLKLVGSAQVRDRGTFLQHGSVLLEDGQDIITQVTRGCPSPPRATSLQAILGRSVTFEEVAHTFANAAREAWPNHWRTSDLSLNPVDLERYRDPDWTWRR